MSKTYAEHLVDQWERADPRDRWRHTGRSAPPIEVRNGPLKPDHAKPSYSTPQSTIDAFWYLVRLGEVQRLADWLADHPYDADYLNKLRRAKERTE